MSRESLVFLLGLVVFVASFLGISSEAKQIITAAAGALLLFIGYKLRRAAYFNSIESASGERTSDMFVENKGPDAAAADAKTSRL